jgi:hypothetical protein
MRKTKFMKMIEIEEAEKMDELNKGDVFLYGTSLIAQKQNKTVGQSISYFQIIQKEGSRIEYTPIFDYMEKDREGEEI